MTGVQTCALPIWQATILGKEYAWLYYYKDPKSGKAPASNPVPVNVYNPALENRVEVVENSESFTINRDHSKHPKTKEAIDFEFEYFFDGKYRRLPMTKITRSSKTQIYRRAYSAFITDSSQFKATDGSSQLLFKDLYLTWGPVGYLTPKEQLPKDGSAKYKGVALASYATNPVGKLEYEVNFKDKTGSGTIERLPRNDTSHRTMLIKLEKADLHPENNVARKYAIAGNARIYADGTELDKQNYGVRFFGPNAEEIGGVVTPEKLGAGTSRHEIENLTDRKSVV